LQVSIADCNLFDVKMQVTNADSGINLDMLVATVKFLSLVFQQKFATQN
jgi:hypothetical protein